jgi:glycosyltransferase involved in cell wall biosynthesis
VVLQLGRIVPRKGIDVAIAAVARLVHAHGIPARLVVVGGESDDPDPERTPEIGRLAGIARAENVADRVAFVGRRPRDRLRFYYNAADAFVTTPWYEPFGMTPLEAMACGTPVIGTAVGGIKHTVADGATGFLVPPRDPDAVADRLARLFRDEALRRRMRAQAIRRVHRHFTWERVVQALEALYEHVAAGAGLAYAESPERVAAAGGARRRRRGA